MNTLSPVSGLSPRDARIQSAQIRAREKMSARAEGAVSRSTTTGTVGEGLACTVTQGDFSITTDLGPGMGGDAAGPSPSFFARAAIAGCIAIAIKMLAATEGLSFASVSVDVETEMDDLALFGLGSQSPAPRQTRIAVKIESDHPRHEVSDIVATALSRDIWYLALRDSQKVDVDLVI